MAKKDRPLRNQVTRAQVNQILKKINFDFNKTKSKKSKVTKQGAPVLVPQHGKGHKSSCVSESLVNASQMDQFSFNPARQQQEASVAMSSTHDVPTPERRLKKV